MLAERPSPQKTLQTMISFRIRIDKSTTPSRHRANLIRRSGGAT